MYIQKIKVTNFKSIYGEFELDLADIEGLWKISGEVGAGKTTIGEAVIFGLFGTINGKNNSELISWGCKHSVVEVWCRSKNHNIRIVRENNSYGQSPVTVYIDNEELVYTNKRDAQAKLEDEYYDISRMTMELLCIISFNNFKSLATLNTRDTKAFLDQVLGFDIITKYEIACKDLRNNSSREILNIETDINKWLSQIDRLNHISNIEIIEGDINEIKSINADLNNKIRNVTEGYNRESQIQNSKIDSLKSQLNTVMTLGKKKKKEVEFIKKGICPTCGAKINQDHIPELIKELTDLKESYNTIKESVDSEIISFNDSMNKFNQEVNRYKIEIDNNLKLIYKLDEQQKRININRNEIESLRNNVNKLKSVLNNYKKEEGEWDELLDIFCSSVRTMILNSFILTFNSHILKYSKQLKLPYIITFDNEFQCHVKLYGRDIDISLSSLSTGQLKTIDTVIIFGMLNMLLGVSTSNIIFLDELFSNMDINLRYDMCRMLNEVVKPKQTIFIISHSDLDDKYFNGKIRATLIPHGQYGRRTSINIEKSCICD